VRTYRKLVLDRYPLQPVTQIAVVKLDDAMTFTADEVVMMAFAAQAVAELTGTVRQGIHNPTLVEERKRPVDRRQPDRFSSIGQPGVDLLRGRGVRFGRERP
jgi:hypothetical protein